MAILLMLLWIIWNGKISVEILLFGVGLTVPILLFARKVLGYSLDNERLFWKNFPLFLQYVVVLVIEIIKSSVAVVLIVMHPDKKPDPVITEFHSGLPTKLQNVLLANSITLTPGTYTLFQEGDRFVVHCLRSEYADGMGDLVFIELLKKMRY